MIDLVISRILATPVMHSTRFISSLRAVVQCPSMVHCCAATAAPFWANFGGTLPTKKVRCPQMPLTDIKIRSAKPQHKGYKLFDSGGLYLEVTTAGGISVGSTDSVGRKSGWPSGFIPM